MKSRPFSDFPRNEQGLVDNFIGTAYDVVKNVSDNMPELGRLDDVLAEIPTLAVTTVNAAVDVAMVPAVATMDAKIDEAEAQVVLATNQVALASDQVDLAEQKVEEASGYATAAQTSANNAASASATQVQILRTELAAASGSDMVSFIQSGTGGVPRTSQNKMRDVVSVKDFGAVGSGLVDDAPAIRAAIAYCLTLLGGTKLVFPIGKYALGSRVDFPKTADTTMTVVGDRAVITRFGSYTGSLFYFGEASNTTSTASTHVEGLIFSGPYLTPAVSPLVVLQHSNGTILEKCVFQSGTIAVSVSDSFAVRFVRCQFSNQTSYGIVSDTACMNSLVDSCQFSDIAAGQAFGGDIYFGGLTHNINIINCDFEGGRAAISSADAVNAFNFVGNYIEGKTVLPFFLGQRSRGVKIENNWIGYNSGAMTWYNITGGSLKYNIFWDQVQSVDVGVSATQCIGFDVGSNAFNGTSTVVGPVWTNPSLINGYTNADGSNPGAGYHQSSDGMVSLRGMVSGAADNACIVLPVGLRPASLQIFASQGSTRLAGTVQITADGNVTCFRSSNGTLSLSGISFYPS